MLVPSSYRPCLWDIWLPSIYWNVATATWAWYIQWILSTHMGFSNDWKVCAQPLLGYQKRHSTSCHFSSLCPMLIHWSIPVLQERIIRQVSMLSTMSMPCSYLGRWLIEGDRCHGMLLSWARTISPLVRSCDLP